jgi:signal transduction histidine kinase
MPSLDPNPPSADAIWMVLVALFSLGGNLATIGLWLAARKRREAEVYPQPLQVQAAEKPPTQQEFQAHVDWNLREHENLFRKIGGVERAHVERMDQKFSELQRHAEVAREKLHERINEILGEVRELKGELKKFP